jgi:ATP-dependent Clp protease ATP-binding subunit ClpB
VDFTNTLIIMTSNLGSEFLAAEGAAGGVGGENDEGAEAAVMAAVRGHFRPEFLNRLDEVLLFQRLTREHMDAIVDIQLGFLQALLDERNISLTLDESARAWLADAGYDPVYGARPLKRVIQKSLQNSLAGMILEGTIGDGETVAITAGVEGILINGKAAEAA